MQDDERIVQQKQTLNIATSNSYPKTKSGRKKSLIVLAAMNLGLVSLVLLLMIGTAIGASSLDYPLTAIVAISFLCFFWLGSLFLLIGAVKFKNGNCAKTQIITGVAIIGLSIISLTIIININAPISQYAESEFAAIMVRLSHLFSFRLFL